MTLKKTKSVLRCTKILTFLVLASTRRFSLCSINLLVHSSLGGSIVERADWYLSDLALIWLIGVSKL